MESNHAPSTNQIPEYRVRIHEFWEAFCTTRSDVSPDTLYIRMLFGDNEALTNSLYPLVKAGIKRAGSSLLWEYETSGQTLPRVGDYWVVGDWSREPQAIVRLTEVSIRPYGEVDAQFAADEGEGDLSLEYWREIHWSFFGRRCEALGQTVHDDMPVVCMRFECVYTREEWLANES